MATATAKSKATPQQKPKIETPLDMAAAPVAPIVSKVLSVRSSREGFRRAGIAWSKEETIVPLSDFTAEQIEQLKRDPALTVEEIEISSQQAGE